MIDVLKRVGRHRGEDVGDAERPLGGNHFGNVPVGQFVRTVKIDADKAVDLQIDEAGQKDMRRRRLGCPLEVRVLPCRVLP